MNTLEEAVNDWTLSSVTREMTIRGYLWDGTTGFFKVDDGNLNSKEANNASYAGIRPVITLSTSQLN